MTISVLDRTDGRTGAPPEHAPGNELGNELGNGLGGLHDAAGDVARDQLPCRVNDPELWFAESPQDVEFAKALCTGCPVRDLCLSGAQQRQEPWGVWGGQLFLQGVVIPRKRPRGRPRKDAA